MEGGPGADPAAIRRFRNRSTRGSTLEKLNQTRQSTPVRVNEPGPESDLDLDALSARLDSVEGLEKAIQAHLFGVEERSRTSLDNKVQEIMRLLEEILETVKCKTAADLQTLGCLADFQKHFTCPPKPPKAGTEPPQSLRAPRKCEAKADRTLGP